MPRLLWSRLLILVATSIAASRAHAQSPLSGDAALSQLLPRNTADLLDSARRVEGDLVDARLRLAAVPPESESSAAFDTLAARTGWLFESARSLTCDSTAAATQVLLLAQEGAGISASLAARGMGRLENDPWRQISFTGLLGLPSDPRATCLRLRAELSDPLQQRALREAIDALRLDVEARDDSLHTERQRLTRAVDSLDARDRLLVATLRDRLQRRGFGETVAILVLVIGLLALAGTVSIGLFPPPVQKEMLASGHVTQIMTGLILVSGALVLGLTGLVAPPALATLMGGAGGFLLARRAGRPRPKDDA